MQKGDFFMKKVLAIGFAALSIFALSACSVETGYEYEEYKALLAEKTFEWDYTKVSVETVEEGKKSTQEYTYDSLTKAWTSNHTEGETIFSDYKVLDIVGYVNTLETSAKILNVDIDDVTDFFAGSNQYRIEHELEESGTKETSTFIFGSNGLLKSVKGTSIDSAGKKTESKETYKYSK